MIPPWSYSLLNDFGNCPRKAHHKYVLKDIPFVSAPALEHGNKVHKRIETAINEKGDFDFELPEIEWHFVSPLIAAGAEAEVKLGMTMTGPAPFFGKPWGRGKLDVLIMKGDKAALVDWKTGKSNRENKFELECQAVLLKANYPEVQTITGSYVWLAENRVGQTFDLSDTKRAYLAIVQATNDMAVCDESGLWPEKPNPLCSYCPVKACKFNRSE